MKRIFIAGPFRGETPYEVHCNVFEAESFILPIAELGACPVCPHTMTAHFDKTLPDEFWLDATSCLLKMCDALIATDRWHESVGACAEIRLMRAMGKPTFTGDRSMVLLSKWLTIQEDKRKEA